MELFNGLNQLFCVFFSFGLDGLLKTAVSTVVFYFFCCMHMASISVSVVPYLSEWQDFVECNFSVVTRQDPLLGCNAERADRQDCGWKLFVVWMVFNSLGSNDPWSELPPEGATTRPLFDRCDCSLLVTWLILPVVICLSQRLSHACLSISFYTVKLQTAH